MMTACPSDEQLLALASGDEPSAEIKSHIEECLRCTEKVSSYKAEVAQLQKIFARTETDPPISAPTAPPKSDPRQIGKYVVVGPLGAGGQAGVYRALHPTLNSQVVIKLSRKSLSSMNDAEKDRLVAEGRILCQLRHPGIGRIHDLDFFERQPFLVMEYVPGRPLDDYARHRPLRPNEIAAMVAKIARAAEAAHRAGIVHQDIKPQNIIIDESDEPRLIDFGLARLQARDGEPASQPLGGTIHYMAPEQARSDAQQITPQTDVFALGAVLYFLLTGNSPFAGPNRLENLARAKNCDFDRDILQLSHIPPRLRQITLKAMALNPADRYPSAEALALALESIGTSDRRRKKIRRAIPVILFLPLVAFWALYWTFFLHKPPLPPAGQQIIVVDGQKSLDGNLPLLNGQKVKIRADVPRDIPTVVFWIGSAGKVFRMPASQLSESGFDQIFAPSESTTTSITGSPGTELILVLSSPEFSDPRAIDALQTQIQNFFNRPLPGLPPDAAVLVDGTRASPTFLPGPGRSRDPGAENPDLCSPVTNSITELLKSLNPKPYFVAGIAVPHEE